MPTHDLPERANLDYLKKLARERLIEMRAADPAANLSHAQLAIAREHGLDSWRALIAEIDRRRAPAQAEFLRACAAGDIDVLGALLRDDGSLVRERRRDGASGLHLAVPHPEAVRLLLEHGADPNVRETGDNVTPLHLAAANRVLDSVRRLLDAGADVHGHGDLHDGGVIGWAAAKGNEAVIDLLLERGARHHIFSAMALRDRDLVQKLVEDDPDALSRRRSRFENGQTPVHAAFAPPDGLGWLAGEPDYAMLQLLIDLGADIDAPDDKGRTPLAVATLRDDREAMRLLRAAGAAEPPAIGAEAANVTGRINAAATSVKKGTPMFSVPDMRATVAWYESIGFTVGDRYEHAGALMFARVSFGPAEFALSPGSRTGPRDVSFWIFTDRIQFLYELFRQRQRSAQTSEGLVEPPIRFEEDLYEPFYGGRQFGIQDLNGLSLVFWEP